MSNPEALFCQIVQAEYNVTVNTIDLALVTPTLALRILKGNIKRFEAVVLAFIEGRLEIIEELILQLVDLLKINTFDRFDSRSFCRVAYSCAALRQSLFPQSGNDPSFVNSIPEAIRNQIRVTEDDSAYEVFEKFVCKLSLRALLDGFVSQTLAEIQAELDELLNRLGIEKIDEWIQDYFNAIVPFLRLMQNLDVFAQCAFETCNFVQTALNKQESVSKKLLLERQATGWSVKADDAINKVINKESELRLRINRLKIQLANPKFGSDGVKPSDLLRF
jgi:hypothetical protein